MSAPEKTKEPEKPKVAKTVTLQRLLKLARPEAVPLGIGTLFLLIGSAASLAYPQGVAYIVDEALGKHDLEKINNAALVMLAVFLVQGVAIAARFILFANAGQRAVARLRNQLFEQLMSQEVGFFDGQKTGDLTSRLSSDCSTVEGGVSSNISFGLRSLVTVLGGLAVLFITSPKLTLMMISVAPPVAIGAFAYGRKVRKMAREAQDALAKSNEVAEESISGIRTVRSFAGEEREKARFGTAISEALAVSKRRIRASATFMGAASTAGYLSAVVVFWFGGRMVIEGQLSQGDLIQFLMNTMQVAFSLGALSELWVDFNRVGGAAERVFELLERKPAIPSKGGTIPQQVEGWVEWQHVDFAYPTRPDVPVLRDFNLKLSQGEVVALVGPSGGGKSTIASLLYRLYDPSKGQVSLDGKPLASLDPNWLRRQIGVVAQEPLLFSTSIAENILYGRPEATQAEVEEAAKLANAHSFISAFPDGYKTLVGERGVQLSGGQKQRVAIARAILKNPRLLILDEATSALDAESEHLVREALERLMEGRTTLIIAHRLSTVKGADRVVVLDAGGVAQMGTHSALVAQDGIYRRLVEKQFAQA